MRKRGRLFAQMVVPQADLSGSQRLGQVDDPLVPGAAKAQGDVLLGQDEFPVHQHVDEGQEAVRHLAPGVGAVGQKLLQGEAGVAPDGLFGVGRLDAGDEGQERPLIGGLHGLAAQERQAVDVAWGQQLHKLVLGLPREGPSEVKVPGLGLEAPLAVIGTAGDEQRHPHAGAVGYVAVFDLAKIHRRHGTRFPPRPACGTAQARCSFLLSKSDPLRWALILFF